MTLEKVVGGQVMIELGFEDHDQGCAAQGQDHQEKNGSQQRGLGCTRHPGAAAGNLAKGSDPFCGVWWQAVCQKVNHLEQIVASF
jgi:hypothetical protein